MKLSNKAVSLIVIAAVLLTAGGVGLLIRQARMGNSQAGGKDALSGSQATSPYSPSAGQTADTPENRAKLKEEQAQILEKMGSLTEEEKEQFRNQVSARYSGQHPGRREYQRLSPEEREQMIQRWQNMSEEERAALRAKMEAEFQAMRRQRQEGSQPSPGENTGTQQDAGKTGSEPNQANQG